MKRCLSCNETYSDRIQGCPKCGDAGWVLDSGSSSSADSRRGVSDVPAAVYVLSGLFFVTAGISAVAAIIFRSQRVPPELLPILVGIAVITGLVGFGLARLSVLAWAAAVLLFTGNLVSGALAFRAELMAAHLFQIALSLIVLAVLLGRDVRRAFSIR